MQPPHSRRPGSQYFAAFGYCSAASRRNFSLMIRTHTNLCSRREFCQTRKKVRLRSSNFAFPLCEGECFGQVLLIIEGANRGMFTLNRFIHAGLNVIGVLFSGRAKARRRLLVPWLFAGKVIPSSNGTQAIKSMPMDRRISPLAIMMFSWSC